MNKIILMGRPTRDPEVKHSQGENAMAIARFTMAIDRINRKEGENNADFLNCVAFGKTAETVEKYVRKGRKILVEGHVQTGSYTNKDGQKVYTFEVVIERQEFCESKSNESDHSNQEVDENGFMNIPDGVDDQELPFNK